LNSHQAIAFMSKNAVDVRKVEVARGARLLLSDLENMTFKVPRVKMDYFQNDLFPPALLTWEPTVNSSDWFAGADVRAKFKVLKPADMEPLYKDLFVRDVARSLSLPDTPAGGVSLSATGDAGFDFKKADNNENKITERVEVEKADNGVAVENNQHHAAFNGSSVAVEPEPKTPINITTTKKLSDGMMSWPPSENGVHSNNEKPKPTPQQRKRISIDPNSGSPLRDLLRRCDEMPGVIAMRGDEEKCSSADSASKYFSQQSAEEEDEWK